MHVDGDFLIMKPFSPIFFLIFGFFIALLYIATKVMRQRKEEEKRRFIAISCLITLMLFFVYKYNLSLDPEYNIAMEPMGGFNWWGELPLHLCNINLILMIVATWFNKRTLMSFCFFVAPLAALMALLMPSYGFEEYSILIPRIMFYYGIHFAIIVEALSIATLGLYRPEFKDLPHTISVALVLAFAVFVFNMLLRITGIYDRANYFFCVETEGNPILDIFYSFLPYPFLYILPCAVILYIYMLAVTAGFRLFKRFLEGRRLQSGGTFS